MNRWLDGLPNWQYVAVVASVMVMTLAIAGCVLRLAAGHLNVSFIAGYTMVFTITITGLMAWKRWK